MWKVAGKIALSIVVYFGLNFAVSIPVLLAGTILAIAQLGSSVTVESVVQLMDNDPMLRTGWFVLSAAVGAGAALIMYYTLERDRTWALGWRQSAWFGKAALGLLAGAVLICLSFLIVLALFRDFEQRYLRGTLSGTFLLQGTQLYVLPDECPDLGGLRVVRPGLHLGEVKKDRFEPNHALALALSAERFAHTMELDDRAVETYLRGETLPGAGDRGWLALTYGGFPLGWGKEAKGTVKNFYPKGLRRMGVR